MSIDFIIHRSNCQLVIIIYLIFTLILTNFLYFLNIFKILCIVNDIRYIRLYFKIKIIKFQISYEVSIVGIYYLMFNIVIS